MKIGSIREYILAEGYKANLSNEEAQNSIIESGVSGVFFTIAFFRSEPFDGDLDTYDGILFSAGLDFDEKPDFELLNLANSQSMMLKAFYEFEATWVELGVPVPDGGLPVGMFEEYFACWTSLLPGFVEQLS